MTLQQIKNRIIKSNIQGLEDSRIWIVNVNDYYSEVGYINRWLSDEEIEQSRQITKDKKRLLFGLRKGIKRCIHSSLLNIKSNEIKYEYTPYGKPFICNKNIETLSFNISHSKEYLLIGVIKEDDIGVDIEKINTNLNHSLLAKSTFSSEELALYRSQNELNKLRCFYKAWVQKEAISKAIGVGISIGFNNLSVSIDPKVNEEEYSISVDRFKSNIRLRVKFEKDYVYAIALLSNRFDK